MTKKGDKITEVPPLKVRDYPDKVLLAWGEAISGNEKFVKFLLQNGYKELGIFCYALRSHTPSQIWLRDNGFFHLLALIYGSEGKEEASEWLHRNGFLKLKYMARAIHGDQVAQSWLIANEKILASITRKMEVIKDNEEYHNSNINTINF